MDENELFIHTAYEKIKLEVFLAFVFSNIGNIPK